MRFAAWYGIVVGVMMLAVWSFFLASGQVPELVSEPYRIALHLAAEFATAILLVAAGIGLLKRSSWAPPLYFIASGMLLYSLIASPGYYAQLGQWAFVGMFGVLLVLDLISIARLSVSSAENK